MVMPLTRLDLRLVNTRDGIELLPADLNDGNAATGVAVDKRLFRSTTVFTVCYRGRDWQKSVRHGKLRSGKYTTCALQKKNGGATTSR